MEIEEISQEGVVTAPAEAIEDAAAAQKRLRIFPLLILAQSLLYGLGDPISKLAYETMPVYTMLAFRYVLALVFFLLVFGRRIFAAIKTTGVALYLPAGGCMALAYIGSNLALDSAAATNVAFLRSLTALITPLLALLLFRRRYRLIHAALQVVVVLGLYLLCAQGGLSGFGRGEGYALLSALFGALALLCSERALEQGGDAVALSAVQTACSAVVCVGMALVTQSGLPAVSPSVWVTMVYLAIGCTVGGYLLQNAALSHLPSRTVAMLQCSYPVMTALLSRLLLGERLSIMGLLGAAIILACVLAESVLKD
ncbi:MAG: DMT family transporter [Oscillospiraceae bacterium]